jgi:hypothetical protein
MRVGLTIGLKARPKSLVALAGRLANQRYCDMVTFGPQGLADLANSSVNFCKRGEVRAQSGNIFAERLSRTLHINLEDSALGFARLKLE